MILRLFILTRGRIYCFPDIVSFPTCTCAHIHILDFHQKEKHVYRSHSSLEKIQVASFFTVLLWAMNLATGAGNTVSFSWSWSRPYKVSAGGWACVRTMAIAVRCKTFGLSVCTIRWFFFLFSIFYFNRGGRQGWEAGLRKAVSGDVVGWEESQSDFGNLFHTNKNFKKLWCTRMAVMWGMRHSFVVSWFLWNASRAAPSWYSVQSNQLFQGCFWVQNQSTEIWLVCTMALKLQRVLESHIGLWSADQRASYPVSGLVGWKWNPRSRICNKFWVGLMLKPGGPF